MRLKMWALVALFLAAIVAANLTLTHWGPDWIVPNAFLLIGLDFVTRDRLADFWGTTRVGKMLALIAAGGLLSYWVNRGAATIAEASAISFMAAEIGEALLYHALRAQSWAARAPRAAILAAAIDSVLFPTLAFHQFVFLTSFDQFCAKVAGATCWAWVILYAARPPKIAPAVPEVA